MRCAGSDTQSLITRAEVGHTLIAILIQLATVQAGFDAWTGAAAGMWYFIGREYAQAEYRLIEHHYGGKRANMPTLAPLRDARAWDRKSTLDWVLPSVIVCLLAYLYN